jgi:regulator of PEP synthase PpsR (kinase-PPPase family)
VGRSYFHLHMVSDSTGETLITVARAVTAQYEGVSAIEHVYPLVRSASQLERVISEIEAAPGIVLYTIVDPDLVGTLEDACRRCNPISAPPRRPAPVRSTCSTRIISAASTR